MTALRVLREMTLIKNFSMSGRAATVYDIRIRL